VTTDTYCSQFWKLENPSSRHQQIWCLARAHFLAHRWHLLIVSSYGIKDKEALWALVRVLALFSSVLTLFLSPLLLPNMITLGVQISA
jgi:hypothetical protein